MRTPERVVTLLFCCFVLTGLFAIGCAEDGASPSVPEGADAMVDVHEDPALAEIVALVSDFRIRSLAAGLDGDDVRRLVGSGDPHALSRRVAYTADEIAARDARMRAAIDDLRGRSSGAEPTSCAPCVDEGVEAWASWLDSEPTLASARIVYMCEIFPLVVDILNCVETTPFGSDAMYTCVSAAVCRNCSGC